MPLYVFVIEVWAAKISFSSLIPVKSYRGKPLRGWESARPPLDQERLKGSFITTIYF